MTKCHDMYLAVQESRLWGHNKVMRLTQTICDCPRKIQYPRCQCYTKQHPSLELRQVAIVILPEPRLGGGVEIAQADATISVCCLMIRMATWFFTAWPFTDSTHHCSPWSSKTRLSVQEYLLNLNGVEIPNKHKCIEGSYPSL